ncbi:YihY/virulence factor BrkB family protein [Plantibacter sp. Mn2098]|uniref:YihY/virulence factor BrkB family protein n=1 Tax=Plantibacter sp. Mn2098 TaxID=3395266 RepID=UPI003BDC922F
MASGRDMERDSASRRTASDHHTRATTAAPAKPAQDAGPDVEMPAIFTTLRESDNSIVKRLDTQLTFVERVTEWVLKLKPYRVLKQYLGADGNLLAAGISFQSVFAVFAAVYVGFAVAGIWLTSNPDLFDALVDIINRAVPGLIGEDGIISPEALTNVNIFGWTGAIAAVGLIWTAIGWLYYTRQAVRAVFELPKAKASFLMLKLVDFLLALAFGVLLFASASLSAFSTQALTWLLGVLGLSGSFWFTFGAGAVGLLGAVLINFVTLGGMYRVLSRIKIPWRDLAFGALLGSIALSVLSIVSSAVIAGASRNPLLATFAVFIGLLLWFNLVSRVILMSASWIAVGLRDKGISVHQLTPAEERAREREAERVLALARLREARAEAAAATWPTKWTAKRRLRDAEAEAERVGVRD